MRTDEPVVLAAGRHFLGRLAALAPRWGVMLERRRNRSQNVRQALRLFLTAQRERSGAHGITVANERGELVAGSGDGLRRVALAGAHVDQDAEGSAWLARSVSTWRLRVGGRYLVVSSLGRKVTVELGEGVRRILSHPIRTDDADP